jgi:tRNA G10  N-methylase Trm11
MAMRKRNSSTKSTKGNTSTNLSNEESVVRETGESFKATLLTPAKLSFEVKRLCNCPERHLNCLTAKEWLKSQLGVWQFIYEKRDIRDKKIHPATFPIGLARRLIELFTHKGELVIDPFVGSGTTLVAAAWIDKEMPKFMRPKYLRFVDALPQTPTYKIEKYKLKEQILKELGKSK